MSLSLSLNATRKKNYYPTKVTLQTRPAICNLAPHTTLVLPHSLVLRQAAKTQHCPYLTDCLVLRYVSMISMEPIHFAGALPSSYSPSHFPTRRPESSLLFTCGQGKYRVRRGGCDGREIGIYEGESRLNGKVIGVAGWLGWRGGGRVLVRVWGVLGGWSRGGWRKEIEKENRRERERGARREKRGECGCQGDQCNLEYQRWVVALVGVVIGMSKMSKNDQLTYHVTRIK